MTDQQTQSIRVSGLPADLVEWLNDYAADKHKFRHGRGGNVSKAVREILERFRTRSEASKEARK